MLVDSVNINGDKAAARDVRFKVGLVFQYPEYQLFEETVYADIAFGPKNMKLTESEIDERVREAAALVGVGEELFERSPLELSGGQKRRVAIAGVIAMRPGVLILDEPTAGLDPAGCQRILETICDYREKTGSTVVIVSHSMDDVARIADRLIVFNHGRIRFDGTPEEVFSNPKELSDIGLSVPAPTQIASALREQGVEIEGSVYTTEQLLAALLKLKRRSDAMLKDITLGQYFPGDTVAHRLDPRTKLLLVIIYIVGLFNAVGWASYAFVILITALSMAISKIKPKSALKGLKPLVIIIILTAVLNIFYTGGTPIIEGWIITWEGIARAVMMSLRIILLIVGTFMLTYTTSPIALTDGLEIMLNPLKKIKIPVHEMSMMMSMALRFIPTLIEETDKIMSAQKARGADFDSGNLFQRAKALLPILVPLFVSAFRRADELAVAMESRCYHGGEGRTRMKQLRMQGIDAWALLLGAAFLAVIFVMKRFGL